MLFQTPHFFVLMSVVLAAMVLLRTRTLQLWFLLVASWYFYASWNPAFLLLLLYSTANDYFIGLRIAKAEAPRARRWWVVYSLATNLGILGVFKYFNFFVDSLNSVLGWAGGTPIETALRFTLPVGISFYTFHSMSYTIDIYRREVEPERSFVKFALYVAFFPQLVAGPILRNKDFLPQLDHPVVLRLSALRSGLNLFLVGLVKKIVVADNVAPVADFVFDHPQGRSSLMILIGTLAFGIQIYCDFSGYTDMARGAARMLGFDIPLNFNYPYFSRTITDFWRRWHISLSTWLRDYLYISLGGNRGSTAQTYRNLLLTMTLGGLWHGASWNFVIWGFYQGLLLAIERAFGWSTADYAPGTPFARTRTLLRWAFNQYLVFLGWLLFRVHSGRDLLYAAKKYVVFDRDFALASQGLGALNPFLTFFIITGFAVVHAWSYRVGGLARHLDTLSRPKLLAVYAAATTALIVFWPAQQAAFIYFQF